ncbi:hypothetical protein TBLA_0I00810 [Henningerozyma blattae CBS 6284]|uniref:Guanine nucleotide-binding protein subunit gamma n=1 Tax=Henningerozyma blattae (strain ATCC 34711 / CBS 6284 / DSM 70876 / NBRC 10599 / NRRL Y-10934 / UCD 77-7) TaxID=1071380 RepID=I2H8N8_HENB6|nr:hypothetical protein TBLA_0I00810 [Tetrapisispora blattae CBS 6284]CCH62740.1 hypothetical protein TBLA_0I00810 [Tetrapisispora blattae CBS 6284]
MSQQQQQLNLKIKYLKLKRINELNNNLKNELQRDRIHSSNACLNLINFTSEEKDFTLPDIWGYAPTNHFRVTNTQPHHQAQLSSDNACCSIM